MPLPWIVAGGLAAAAGLVGIGGHLSAKETNERAQEIAKEAEELYNETKQSLEMAQKETEAALLALGNSKKKVLESSINQFLTAYSRVKDIELVESSGLNELSKFVIDEHGVLQLQEMSSVYSTAFSSGATGAATGAVIALAASGSLPVVTGVLSTAGTALMVGQIGTAASLAGSALSFGAAMTPLSAIAAPVVLFTGISSSIKAEENLEKALTMQAEAEAASEQMKTAEVLCKGITERADMFDRLLCELNQIFTPCVVTLDKMTKKKIGVFKKKISADSFSEDELKLIAVTRALAGAVKSVIDTPILDKDGKLFVDAETVYDKTKTSLPAFASSAKAVLSQTEKANALSAQITNVNTKASQKTKKGSLKLVVLWGFTAVYLACGIRVISTAPISAALFFLSSIIACPLVFKKKTVFGKLFVAVAFFLLAGALMFSLPSTQVSAPENPSLSMQGEPENNIVDVIFNVKTEPEVINDLKGSSEFWACIAPKVLEPEVKYSLTDFVIKERETTPLKADTILASVTADSPDATYVGDILIEYVYDLESGFCIQNISRVSQGRYTAKKKPSEDELTDLYMSLFPSNQTESKVKIVSMESIANSSNAYEVTYELSYKEDARCTVTQTVMHDLIFDEGVWELQSTVLQQSELVKSYVLPDISTQFITDAVNSAVDPLVGQHDGTSGTISSDESDPLIMYVADCKLISTEFPCLDLAEVAVDLELYCNQENGYVWEVRAAEQSGAPKYRFAGEYTLPSYYSGYDDMRVIFPDEVSVENGELVFRDFAIIRRDYAGVEYTDTRTITMRSMPSPSEGDPRVYIASEYDKTYFIFFDADMKPFSFAI